MRQPPRLYAICLYSLLISSAVFANAADRPPNIVMFLIDDLGYTDLGCFGSSFYETPQIDRLAATGMRFTSAYAACPVCSPTRASIMTGRWPQRSGITDYINPQGGNQPEKWERNTRLLPAVYKDRLEPDEITIAELLHEAGYATFFAGKWHLGPEGYGPEDQGFDVVVGGGNGTPSHLSPYRIANLPDGPEGESLTQRLADEACQFIEKHADRPFFAYLPMYAVHIPLQAPTDVVRKYETKAGAAQDDESNWAQVHRSRVRLVQNHPTYAAMVEAMDSAVGTVLAKLDELQLSENTVVVFTSDNGGLATAEGHSTSNLPLRAGKGWLYEGGIRVPTIVRWPGVTRPGSVCATPILSTDYYPTLREIAARSVEPEHPVDGMSFVRLLRGESMERGPLFWDYPHYGNQGGAPSSAVRDGRWKLIEWWEDGAIELFDLEADIGEKENLADRHPEVVARLRAALEKWRQEVGAKPAIPNPKYESR